MIEVVVWDWYWCFDFLYVWFLVCGICFEFVLVGCCFDFCCYGVLGDCGCEFECYVDWYCYF